MKRFRGGARVGSMKGSWPLAELEVEASSLRIRGFLLGDHRFQPEDVLSFEPAGIIPILGRGIRVVHRRDDIPKTVVFYHFLGPSGLVDRIGREGFRPAGRALGPLREHEADGNPFKRSVAIGGVIAWNVLFLADIVRGVFPGVGILVALWGGALSAILTLTNARFRARVLREGHSSLGHVRGAVTLSAFILGAMAVAFTLVYVLVGPQKFNLFTG